MLTYPLWLLLFAVFPTIFLSIWKFKLIKKYWKVFGFTLIGSFIFSYPWDYIAVTQKIWFFNEPYIFGKYLFGLPYEEYVFIGFETLIFVFLTLILFERSNK